MTRAAFPAGPPALAAVVLARGIDAYTNAECPVIARPTIMVLISFEPS